MKIGNFEVYLKKRTRELKVWNFTHSWFAFSIKRTPKFQVSFEKTKRETQIGWESLLIRSMSLLLGIGMVGIVLLLNGVNPILLPLVFVEAFFTSYGLVATMRRLIPILCIAIGLAIPFKARIDNIGAEGQYIIGAISATGTAFFFSYLPAIVLIPLMFLNGFIAGALWAIPVAIFRVKGGFKGSDVVLSFLLFFPAFFLMEHLVTGPWRDQEGWGFPITPILPEAAQIPRFPGTTVHFTIFVALAATILIYYFLFMTREGIPKTKLGYEINVMGKNPEAGEATGINFLKIALITMAISGGMAGIAGVGEVAGIHLRLRLGITTGYGYTGIAVAWLGALNPIGILVSSFFFAGLMTGAVALEAAGLPFSSDAMVDLFNGSILFFVLIAELFLRYTIEWRRI